MFKRFLAALAMTICLMAGMLVLIGAVAVGLDKLGDYETQHHHHECSCNDCDCGAPIPEKH